MRCPDCEYELRSGQEDCPRCSFRRTMQQTVPAKPPPLAEPLAAVTAEGPPVAVDPPAHAPFQVVQTEQPPPAVAPAGPRRRPLTALLGIALPLTLLALGLFLYQRATRLTPREAQAKMIFMASTGPCRQGDQAPCMESVHKMRALGDRSDGALLLGDYRIAHYVRTLPGGDQLAARWRQDQFTAADMKSMGDAAYAKNLDVYHSFYIYESIKSNHTPVPQLNMGSAGQ